jgi:hypothetical protein
VAGQAGRGDEDCGCDYGSRRRGNGDALAGADPGGAGEDRRGAIANRGFVGREDLGKDVV